MTASLADDARLELTRELVAQLPASECLALLAGLPLDRVLEEMRQENRRPEIVAGLVERGQETRRIDFAQIPPGCNVSIMLHDLASSQTPKVDDHQGTLNLRSHGGGLFSPTPGLHHRTQSGPDWTNSYISEDHLLRLCRENLRTKEPTSDIEFKQSIGFMLEEGHEHGGTGQVIPFECQPARDSPWHPLSLGQVIFDLPKNYWTRF